MANPTAASRRNYLTSEEELRLAALRLAHESVDETASDVIERADKYAKFLLKGETDG